MLIWYHCGFPSSSNVVSTQMALLAYGVSFRTAPIDMRERIAFAPQELPRALSRLGEVPSLSEATILSTCNRTEIYCALDAPNHDPVADWLARDRGVPIEALADAAYALWNTEAAAHVMRVAAGLESQVLGEPQIQGQVKSAFDAARQTSAIGPELDLLSRSSLNIAKRIRTETDVGKNPISIAYAAVTMAQHIFADLSMIDALLVGAGEMIELVSRHLGQAGVRHIGIANRTFETADLLARANGSGSAIQLHELDAHLAQYDIVISSTGSADHVITRRMIEYAVRQRRHKPMFLVDIAVPRDIEPAVGELDDVFLYSIDDLTEVIEDNVATRRKAAEQAEAMIAEGVGRYARQRRVRDNQALLRRFRQRAEEARDEELARALQRLDTEHDPEKVIERLARDLTNKLVHGPIAAIRDASADGRTDILNYLRSRYGLD